jgi:nicotinate-nucleotide adenylyltransferase
MNIAIFGGSFDGFHKGHREVIEQSLYNLKIKKLIIIPTFCNPLKQKAKINAKNRTKILIQEYKKNKKILVCNYEVLQKRKSYTINTILYLHNKYKNIKNLYLIIGADNLAKIKHWKRWNGHLKESGIKHKIKLVVANRNNIAIKQKNIKIHKILNVMENISSSDIKTKNICIIANTNNKL